MCKNCVLIDEGDNSQVNVGNGQVTWHFNGLGRALDAGREWRLLLQPGDGKVDALYGAAVLVRYAATAAEVAVPI